MLYSSVTLVDLPGAVKQPSEDAVKKKEDVAITKMLSNLHDCINMMTQEQAKGGSKKGKAKVVIPWRSSKLTMLLRDKIGGNNLTVMIGAISPAADELGNSRRTLEFLQICGALRQPPIEEREANVSVVEVGEKDPKKRAAKAQERAEAKEKIRRARREKRARGEKIYDEQTGEELHDDDDLDVDEGSTGLAGMLDDPDAIVNELEEANGNDGSHIDDARLRAHAQGLKALSRLMSPEAFMRSVLDAFPAQGKFRRRMLEIDRRLAQLRQRLRLQESKRRQLLAQIASMVQVYLKFDSPNRENDASEALRTQLAKLRSMLKALEGLSGRASRAWTRTQLQQIKERFEALVGVQAEIGARRRQMIPILEEQCKVIRDATLDISEEQQRVDEAAARRLGKQESSNPAAMWNNLAVARRLARGSTSQQLQAARDENDDDGLVETLSLECLLHDLGLLTARVESEISCLSSPPSASLLDPTLGYGMALGKELHAQAKRALDGLTPSEEARPRSLLARLRTFAGLVTKTGDDLIDEVDSMLDSEATARRRDALQREAALLSPLIGPPTEVKATDSSMVLNATESEMSRVAKGLSDAIQAILDRMLLNTKEARALEERLQRAVAPFSAAQLAASRKPIARRRLAAGECHTLCVRASDGATFSWGSGDMHHSSDGTLQDLSDESRSLAVLGHGLSGGPCMRMPKQVAGLSNVTVLEVAAGVRHTLFLGACGRVWSCGVGKFGALGHGDQANQDAPRRIELPEVRGEQVAAGDFHSHVLSSEGHVYSFGWGGHGRLGLGDVAMQPRPLRVAALEGTQICQVSAGSTHSLAVGVLGELYAWGCSTNGRLGLGEEVAERIHQPLPVMVELPKYARAWQASAGGSHSLLVATDGSLFSFGNNGHGQLGQGDTADRFEPSQVRAMEGMRVQTIDAGRAHSVVHIDGGSVFTFGQPLPSLDHSDEQTDQLLPTAVATLRGKGLKAVVNVAAGPNHIIVQLANGELRSFGSNEFGQLGDEAAGAATVSSSEPLSITLPAAQGTSRQAPLWQRKAAAVVLQAAWRRGRAAAQSRMVNQL